MKEKIVRVDFNPTPKVVVRTIKKTDDAYTVKNKKKYPFELKKDVHVTVITSKRMFEVLIKKGYRWNGADIPKCLFIFGQSKDNNYLHASMVHDYLLEHKGYVFNDVLNNELTVAEYRRLTSLIFREILKDEKTNVIKANIMAWAVDMFQATANRKQWECLE